MKQILGFALCSESGLFKPSNLMAASIIFDLEQSAVYKSLHKLRSVLNIPRPKRAHLSGISFRNPSFIHYLTDPTRSKDFYIDVDESCDDLVRRLSQLFLEESWNEKCNQFTPKLSDKAKKEFFSMLMLDAKRALRYGVTGELKQQRGRGPFVSQEDRSECLDLLSQVNTADLFEGDGMWLPDFTNWLFRLWGHFSEELRSRGLVNVIRLRDLNVGRLGRGDGVTLASCSSSNFLDLAAANDRLMGWVESGRYYSPNTKVLIFGSTPEKRSAVFCHESGEQLDYCHMPYPY